MDEAATQSLHGAFQKDDVAAIRAALVANPKLRDLVNSPIGPFDTYPIANVRSPEMLDLLLEYGADINAKSKWWAGGFCLLDSANDDLAQHAIKRGARVEIHAAARLGMIDRVRELIAADPALVNAPGGDGKRPLHFARNVEIARFLLDRGAEVDAKDIDHESTPAQYQIENHHDVVRLLIERGGRTDIFMAAALGDPSLLEHHLKQNPNSIRQRIDNSAFPMSNPRAGGTIYFWTLGRDFSPHQVAKKFSHEKALQYLFSQSPPEIQLINYCWAHDEGGLKALLAKQPNLASHVSQADLHSLPNAARDRDHIALRLFLEAGLPIDAPGQHQATALHWAAWHGDVEAVKLLLQHKAPLEAKDRDFNSTPLHWTMHGSENGWHCSEGNYPEVARLLLRAGAKVPEKIFGKPEVQKVIKEGR
jgi:ankyrin repeat protein